MQNSLLFTPCHFLSLGLPSPRTLLTSDSLSPCAPSASRRSTTPSDASMPPKFAQDKHERDRSRDPILPNQPSILSAAEFPYRVNHAIPPRPVFQQYPKASTSALSPSASASNYNLPYHQRLVAAALATPEDPHSSNDSSSAPSSNAVSSSVLSAGTSSATTSSTSPSISKGKGRETTATTIPSVPRTLPPPASIPPPITETPEFEPDTSYFELLMENNSNTLPEPGLSYFERRRVLWMTVPPNPPRPSSPSPSRIKLEALLNQPGAVESEEVWRAGLKNVWKGLVGGNQLRKRLPLHIVLKILQAGWLRDGTWPEGMVAPAWDVPMKSPQQSPPPDDPPQASMQGPSQEQRRAHEQEAYAAALHARASAEQAVGTAQVMHMQAYAMMGLAGGIPPGYSPSSGDNPEASEAGYYVMPYAYAEATPPPGTDVAGPGARAQMRRGQELAEGQRRNPAERRKGPPLTPLRPQQELESEMDTEDEAEDAEVAAGRRMEGVVQTGDDRHEGG